MNKRDALFPGAILLIEFPFAEKEERKSAPVLVVSNKEFIEQDFRFREVIVARMTKKKPPLLTEHHVFVKKDDEEGKKAGLKFDSYIRLDKLLGTDERAVDKYLGKFSEEFMQQISEKCKSMF